MLTPTTRVATRNSVYVIDVSAPARFVTRFSESPMEGQAADTMVNRLPLLAASDPVVGQHWLLRVLAPSGKVVDIETTRVLAVDDLTH